MKLNNENTPYELNQDVTVANGFGAMFKAKIKDVFFDDNLKRYHYSFYSVELLKKASFDFGSKSANSLKETYLHSHIKNVEIKTDWTTDELTKEFKVIGFCGGYVAVERISDGVKGSLDFNGKPRIYFNFKKA